MTAQTSEHGGLIYGLAAEGDSAADAVSAAVTRDVVVNGLLHLLDSSGQMVVNFASVTAGEVEQASPPTDEVTKMCEWAYPMRLRHGDESGFRLVVKTRISISAAGTATFRLALKLASDLYTTPRDPASFPVTNVAEISTTSTSGEDKSATIYLNAAQIRRATYAATASVDAEGNPSVAFYIPATFQIWAKSSVGSSLPRILSLTAIEYTGER